MKHGHPAQAPVTAKAEMEQGTGSASGALVYSGHVKQLTLLSCSSAAAAAAAATQGITALAHAGRSPLHDTKENTMPSFLMPKFVAGKFNYRDLPVQLGAFSLLMFKYTKPLHKA